MANKVVPSEREFFPFFLQTSRDSAAGKEGGDFVGHLLMDYVWCVWSYVNQ